MLTVDIGFIATFIRKQCRSIRSFPFVSVVVLIMLNNYQTFANFVEIYMHKKQRHYTFFYAKKLKIKTEAFDVFVIK